MLALLTKPIGGPAAAVVIVAMLGFGSGPRTLTRRLAAIAALAVTLAGTYLVEAASAEWSPFGVSSPLAAIRYGVSYMWQFYLPPLSFMDAGAAAYHAFHSLPSWRVWVETGVGFFGWLTTPMPAWAYNLAFWSLVVATASRCGPASAGARRVTGRFRLCWLRPWAMCSSCISPRSCSCSREAPTCCCRAAT